MTDTWSPALGNRESALATGFLGAFGSAPRCRLCGCQLYDMYSMWVLQRACAAVIHVTPLWRPSSTTIGIRLTTGRWTGLSRYVRTSIRRAPRFGSVCSDPRQSWCVPARAGSPAEGGLDGLDCTWSRFRLGCPSLGLGNSRSRRGSSIELRESRHSLPAAGIEKFSLRGGKVRNRATVDRLPERLYNRRPRLDQARRSGGTWCRQRLRENEGPDGAVRHAGLVPVGCGAHKARPGRGSPLWAHHQRKPGPSRLFPLMLQATVTGSVTVQCTRNIRTRSLSAGNGSPRTGTRSSEHDAARPRQRRPNASRGSGQSTRARAAGPAQQLHHLRARSGGGRDWRQGRKGGGEWRPTTPAGWQAPARRILVLRSLCK